MPDWFWQKIMEQWAVVKAAGLRYGFAFLISWVLVAFVTLEVVEWINRKNMQALEERISLCRERLEGQCKEAKNVTDSKIAREAELRLLIHDDERDPARLSDTNIWRWVWLKYYNTDLTTDGSVARVARVTTLNTLFISFTTPMTTSAVDIRSPDFTLPPYEVHQFNPRFAIITFEGKMPAGTLEISMRP